MTKKQVKDMDSNYRLNCPRCESLLMEVLLKPFFPIIFYGKREKYKGDVLICWKCSFQVSGIELNYELQEYVGESIGLI